VGSAGNERVARGGKAAVAGGLLVLLLGAVGSLHAAGRTWETFLYGGECFGAVGRDSAVWVCTGAGLRTFQPVGDEVRVRDLGLSEGVPAAPVTSLLFVNRQLWIGAAGGVVARLDLETNRWQTYDQAAQFPAADVTSLAFDGQDIWAATRGAGVAEFSELKQEWRVWNQADGLPSDQVNALAADAGGLWAATDRGLARLDRNQMVWRAIRGPQSILQGRVADLALSGKHLWIAAGADGLGRIQLDNGAFLAYDLVREYGARRVDRLLLTADGSLWAGLDNGIVRAQDEGAGRWSFLRREPWQVTGLTSAGGALWVATRRGGLWRYRPEGGDWQQFRPNEPLPSGEVTAADAQTGTAWLGFRQDGIARYDVAGERWQNLVPKDGAPRQVRDLAARDRFVYCACGDGIAVYDDREQRWQTVTSRFNSALGGDEWNSVLLQGDKAWFAGPGRLALFAARNMELLWTAPLRDLAAFGEEAQPRLYDDPYSADVWIATASSLLRYHARHNQLVPYEGEWLMPASPDRLAQSPRVIRDIACDNDSVWLVGIDKVLQFRKQDDAVVEWNTAAFAGLKEPTAAAVSRSEVFVASAAGVCRFNRQAGAWSLVPWPAELVGERPTALALDSAVPYHVWVTTGRSVARLELADKPTWRVFPRDVHLVPGTRRILTTRTGVWFVGRAGVTLYRRHLEDGT
jgi:frataxin-like iron-binding protein CyaY